MDSDELRPLPDDLFDETTATHGQALDQLREHLLRIGYRVHRRAAREKTLRVYLDDGIDYPLLNPRITTVPLNYDEDGEPLDDEVLPVVQVAVLSNGDAEIDERLRDFPNGEGRLFLPLPESASRGYHGNFFIDLSLRQNGDIEEVDYPPLIASFRLIRRFLLGEDIPKPRNVET